MKPNTGDLVEVALDEAEKARAALVEDNKHLKTLVLKAVNSIQRIVYQSKALLDDRIELVRSHTCPHIPFGLIASKARAIHHHNPLPYVIFNHTKPEALNATIRPQG